MVKEGDNSFGVAALILGLLSVIFFFTSILSTILGIIGLVFAIIQYRRNKNSWAIWALVLSILGIIFSLVITWEIVSTIQQVALCLKDPTMPGCEQFAQALSQQSTQIPYATA